MADEAPILILGGGINGAAIARELVLQGRGVVLVDQGDIGCGATAYSSRLIHGGLRYLEYGELDLVRESLRERGLLLANAPQHVRPLRFFIPSDSQWSGMIGAASRFLRLPLKPAAAPRGQFVVRTGLWMYDRFARSPWGASEGFVQLPPAKTHRLDEPDVPRVARPGVRGLVSYSDAQVQFPERFTVGLLRDAARIAVEKGVRFQIATHHSAALDGSTATFKAQLVSATRTPAPFAPAAVINATGAWVDETLAKLHVPSERLIGGTKGSHFFTWNVALQEQMRGHAVYAEAADGRPVFVLPFAGGTLVGTTDIPYSGDPGEAVASDEELEYLLAVVRSLFPQVPITRDDITLHGCGVRPLPYVGAKTPASVTRRHWVKFHESAPVPMISVIGGKLTTCRSLGEETAEAVLKRLGSRFESGLSRHRPLPPEPELPPPSDSITVEQLRTFVHDEWATTLDDLVERRLMWLYRPELKRSHLESLAAALIELQLYKSEEISAAVTRTINRLADHFGRRLA